MKQNNNNNGDRYGNLLNNYMKSIEKKEYSHMLEHEAGKHREEGKDRYGDLLKNAKKNNKIYDDILNMDKARLYIPPKHPSRQKYRIKYFLTKSYTITKTLWIKQTGCTSREKLKKNICSGLGSRSA